MTTVELAQRMLRWTAYESIGQVPADALLGMAEGIAGGLRDWFIHTPADFARKTVSRKLRTSQTASGLTFTSGSKEFSAPSSLDLSSYVGCTCKIGSESNYNRIVRVGEINELLFESETSGSASMQYWRDAVELNTYARLVRPPKIRGRTLTMWRDDDRDQDTWNNNMGNYPRADWLALNFQQGTPDRYWVDSQTVTEGGDAPFVMRVWPLPATDEQISFDVEVFAGRVTLAELTTSPRELPVPDEHCEAILVPLCAKELTSERFFKGNKEEVKSRGATAIGRARSILPLHSGYNKVYTPNGW